MRYLMEKLLKSSGNSLPEEIYPDSVHHLADNVVAMAKGEEEVFLILTVPEGTDFLAGFNGEIFTWDEGRGLLGNLDAVNAAALRRHFPWTAPVSLRKERTTIGCGDRLGLASAGHIKSIRKFAASPVLAQQSMRELTMTGRSYRDVVDDATFMVFRCDYRDGFGADGDHLKTIGDIDMALAAGMPMITLDLSEVMNAGAADWDITRIEEEFVKMDGTLRDKLLAEYDEKIFRLATTEVKFEAGAVARCAVMYNAALDFAQQVYNHIRSQRGEEFDLEISIDETSAPTLPSHHFFITRELHRRGVVFSSLAPRFIGEFQKAIDYIGDLAEFDRQFKVHAEIAGGNGNYKLSIHSGSDKFKVYPTIGRDTEGYLHLKTAGTSWLVAVEVIARTTPGLYRKMHQCALDNYPAMLKLYHITADFGKIPDISALSDAQLPDLMEMPEARQLLHISYGAILQGKLKEEFYSAMFKAEDAYERAIEKHFDKHISLLGIPNK